MSTDRPRVLITGAGGFIGRHVVAAAPADWDVIALSRQDAPDAGAIRPVRWSGELSDPLPPALTEPFDVTIHLAGNASHAVAASEPWRDLIASGGVAGALLSRVLTRRVVLLSSAAVYAGLEGPVHPGLPVDPPMAYALSKRYVEGFVRALASQGKVEEVAIFRLYNAFGRGERPSRLIPRVAQAIAAGRPLELTGDPSSLSDPVEVKWVGAALIAAVAHDNGGTFDLCGGDPVPLAVQVGRISEALGAPRFDVVLRPNPGEEPIRFWSDPAPAIEAFGLAPPTPFPDAVRSYARSEGWI